MMWVLGNGLGTVARVAGKTEAEVTVKCVTTRQTQIIYACQESYRVLNLTCETGFR